MGGSYVGNAATFLIGTLFGLYILIVMLRLLLQWVRADFYNPISQAIIKVTQPVLRPMRQIIPGLHGIDLASVTLLFVLKYVELWLTMGILGYSTHVAGLSILTLAELIALLINVFLFSILIQVVLSWLNPGSHNPVTALLDCLNEPLLRPARRLVQPIGGLDLSPIVVLLILQLASILLVAPIRDLGRGLL